MASQEIRGILHNRPVAIGDRAPEFELPALIGGVRKSLRLSDYRGRQVILAFYPFNWRDASLQQMAAYQEHRERLRTAEAVAAAISVESIMNTTAWERHSGPFDFALCSDFWPHGEVSARYGVLRESGDEVGAAERTVFTVDGDGRIASRKAYGWDQVPPIEDVLWELNGTR
jgi:peroxiredoxin